jgi:hypothetical protein
MAGPQDAKDVSMASLFEPVDASGSTFMHHLMGPALSVDWLGPLEMDEAISGMCSIGAPGSTQELA